MSEQAIFRPEHVGQVVSDPSFGDGIITKFTDCGVKYPVNVKFQAGDATFTIDGRVTDDSLPTLQFGPLDNWQRRTVPQLRDGDLVEVKRHNNQWILHSVIASSTGPCIVKTRNDKGEPYYWVSLHDKEWRFYKP